MLPNTKALPISADPHVSRTVGIPFATPIPLTKAIFQHLGKAIVQGRMRPGERLIETKLCEQFGCSRSPLREAIAMLAAESLVTIEPRRGAQVAKLSGKAVSELFDVRLVLECLAVRLAAEHRTTEQLSLLTDLNASMSEAVKRNDPSVYFELNSAFHGAIAQIGDNSYLASLQKSAADRSFVPLFMFLSDLHHLEDAIQGHAAIVDALLQRDAGAAEALMRSHILAARKEAKTLVDIWLSGAGEPQASS